MAGSMAVEERSLLDLLALVKSFDAEAMRFWQNTHLHDRGSPEGDMFASESATARQVRRQFVLDQLRFRDDVQLYTDRASTEGCPEITHFFDVTSRDVLTCNQVVDIVMKTRPHFHRMGAQCRDQTSEFSGALMYSDRHKQYFPLLIKRGQPYNLSLQTDAAYRQGVITFHTHCDVSLIQYAVHHADFVRIPENSVELNDQFPRTRDLTAIPSSVDFIDVFLQTCTFRACAVGVLLSHHGVTVYAPNFALTQYIVGMVSWEDAPEDFVTRFYDRIIEDICLKHSMLIGACLRQPDSTHPTVLPMFIRNTTDFLDVTNNGEQYGFDCVFIPFEEQDPQAHQMFSEMKAEE
jgi:hypothetical protein